ncbi:PKD domain-containing protein [bacterium]|nr:PKD domain-containing protein [bacterium]
MTGLRRLRLFAGLAAVAALTVIARVGAHELSPAQPRWGASDLPLIYEYFPTVPTGPANSGWDQENYKEEMDQAILWWHWIPTTDMPGGIGAETAVACPTAGDGKVSLGVCVASPGIIAWASPRWQPSGAMFECDFSWNQVWVDGNTANGEVTLEQTDNSLRAVGAHELGHCWGYAHTFDGIGPDGFNGDFQSVMNYATPPGFPGKDVFGVGVHYDPRAFHDVDDGEGKYPCNAPGGCRPDDTGGGGGPPPGTPTALILAGPAVTGNAPLTVTFDGSQSSDTDGFIVLYQWDFDDGNGPQPTDQSVVQYTFGLNCTPSQQDAKGNCFYNVELVVIDDDQTFSPPAKVVIMVRDPSANIDPVPLFAMTCLQNCAIGTNVPFPINLGDGLGNSGNDEVTFLFDASGSFDEDGSIVDYLWEFGDGTVSALPVVEHSFLSGGIFPIIIAVTDNDGDVGDNRLTAPFIVVPAHPIPVISNFPPGPALGSIQVRHDGAASFDDDGRIISYYWFFSDGSEGFKAIWTKTFAYDPALDDDWGPDGLFGDGVVPLDPQDAASPNFQDVNADTYDDDLDNLDFDDTPGQITYRSVLQVTDDESLTNATEKFLVVADITGSTIDLEIDGTPNPVGAGVTVFFTATISSPGTAVNYTWDFGDGNTLSGSVAPPDDNWVAGVAGTLEHVYSAGGTYSASLALKDGQGVVVDSAAQMMNVAPSGTKADYAGGPPPPLTAGPGDEIVVLWFKLNESSAVNFPVLVQETDGDGLANIGRVQAVALYRDINANGLLDAGDIFLGSAPFVGGQASLSAPASPVGAHFLVTYRFF